MMRLWIAARVDREMEARLIKRGLYMVPREDGNGSEVGGVSPQVAEMFSSRARGISPELDRLLEQYKQAHGREASARTRWLLGQQAAQNTRRAKARARQRAGGVDHGEDLDEATRLKAWEDQVTREELGALSQVWRDVEAFGAGKRHHSPEMEDLGRAARIAVAEVQKQHSVWSVAELAFEVNRALPPGASVGDIDIAVALAVTDSEVLEVAPAPDPVDTSSLGVRKDGTSVYRPPNEARYTTTGQLDLESRIMELARRKRPVMVTEAAGPGGCGQVRPGREPGRGRGQDADLGRRGHHPDGTGRHRQDAHGLGIRAAVGRTHRATGHRPGHLGERGPGDGRGGARGRVQHRRVPGQGQRVGRAPLPDPDPGGRQAGPGRVQPDLDRGPRPRPAVR